MSVINKSKGDKYFTPRHAWTDIQQYIPKDKVIWEPFNNSNDINSLKSAQYLKDMGLDVIVKPYNDVTGDNDFFTSDYGDIVVSNPPFSIKRKIMDRLYDLDKPFILICPIGTVNAQYFKKFTAHTQIIVPSKRLNFLNGNDSVVGNNFGPQNPKQVGAKRKTNCCFDTFYICYKMDLPRDLIFLS